MHPKIKNRPARQDAAVASVMPLMAHDVTNQKASANAASRLGRVAPGPAAGSANHARHHVSRQTQS